MNDTDAKDLNKDLYWKHLRDLKAFWASNITLYSLSLNSCLKFFRLDRTMQDIVAKLVPGITEGISCSNIHNKCHKTSMV